MTWTPGEVWPDIRFLGLLGLLLLLKRRPQHNLRLPLVLGKVGPEKLLGIRRKLPFTSMSQPSALSRVCEHNHKALGDTVSLNVLQRLMKLGGGLCQEEFPHGFRQISPLVHPRSSNTFRWISINSAFGYGGMGQRSCGVRKAPTPFGFWAG